MIWGWIRFWIVTLLMLAGLFVFITTMLGIFRFRYVLNRLHAAAKGDTMGIFLTLLSLMVLSGLNVTTLKLFLLIVFIWLSNPVSSHLIAHLEVETNQDILEECKVVHLDAD